MPNNGQNGTTNHAPDNLRRMEDLVANVSSMGRDFFRSFIDPRRDIGDECGFPKSPIAVETYQELFDRDPIAARVVEVMPRECWQVSPSVYEDDDPDTVTPFEQAWDDLAKSLRGEKSWFQDEAGSPIWDYLRRLDELSGIGTYGILLLGLDDGRDLDTPASGFSDAVTNEQPVFVANFVEKNPDLKLSEQPAPEPKGKKKATKLTFLRVFPETLVQVVQYESNPASPRFDRPVRYLVTFNDPRVQTNGSNPPQTSRMVHWSRVIHVADGLASSELFGTPRMQPVLNNLLSLQKIYGGDGEAWWKNCCAKLILESQPDVQINQTLMKDALERFGNGMQNWLALMGMTAKTLPPAVVDPAPHVAAQLQAICIKLAMPQRIFMGSERGELASSQDDAQWNDQIRGRQVGHCTARIIIPLVDRLIALGVLPEPSGYSVLWPDLDSLSGLDKANIALIKTQTLAAFVGGNVESIYPPMEYLTGVFGDTDEGAASVLENASAAAEDRMTPDPSAAPPAPPGANEPPPPEETV